MSTGSASCLICTHGFYSYEYFFVKLERYLSQHISTICKNVFVSIWRNASVTVLTQMTNPTAPDSHSQHARITGKLHLQWQGDANALKPDVAQII